MGNIIVAQNCEIKKASQAFNDNKMSERNTKKDVKIIEYDKHVESDLRLKERNELSKIKDNNIENEISTKQIAIKIFNKTKKDIEEDVEIHEKLLYMIERGEDKNYIRLISKFLVGAMIYRIGIDVKRTLYDNNVTIDTRGESFYVDAVLDQMQNIKSEIIESGPFKGYYLSGGSSIDFSGRSTYLCLKNTWFW